VQSADRDGRGAWHLIPHLIPRTTPAKTVADCFRFRRHVGLEVALAALEDYLRKRKGSIDVLVEAASADRIYSVMRPYLEALA
jgi:hypothetical protein